MAPLVQMLMAQVLLLLNKHITNLLVFPRWIRQIQNF